MSENPQRQDDALIETRGEKESIRLSKLFLLLEKFKKLIGACINSFVEFNPADNLPDRDPVPQRRTPKIPRKEKERRVADEAVRKVLRQYGSSEYVDEIIGATTQRSSVHGNVYGEDVVKNEFLLKLAMARRTGVPREKQVLRSNKYVSLVHQIAGRVLLEPEFKELIKRFALFTKKSKRRKG